MTYSDYKKVFKQLQAKPVKLKVFLKHNAPKKLDYGSRTTLCKICGNPRGHIRKYGIHVCRRCFREVGPKLGFKKYS